MLDDYWQQRDSTLVVVPDGAQAWLDCVSAFSNALIRHDLRDVVVFRGREVAVWAAIRRLYARGARRVGILHVAPGPCGLPYPTSVDFVCERCLNGIVGGGPGRCEGHSS